MAIAKRHPPAPTLPRDVRERVLGCVSKLSDRDTHAIAASELEAIAVGLSPAAVPAFISCLHIPDAASAKSPVRVHCVRLLSLVARHHRDAVCPFLSRMLSAVLNRLRDPDSAVRSACVDAVSDMASQIVPAPFTAFQNPLAGALFTEQDLNSQIGSALCLSAAVVSAPDPDLSQLQRLVPRLVKLLKCDGFKAKPALLTLVGSVIGTGGVSTSAALRNLVPCMLGFLSSVDWAARKAAAEAFVKLAVAESSLLTDFKPSCLKTFENRRYDKVKAVRDTMNLMVEAWRKIPDVDEVSPPSRSQSFSKKEANVDAETPHTRHNQCTPGQSPPSKDPSAAISRRRTVPQSASNTNPNPNRNMAPDWKFGISPPDVPSESMPSSNDQKRSGGGGAEDGVLQGEEYCSNPEIKRFLFMKTPSDENPRRIVGFMAAGSRAAPSPESPHNGGPKTSTPGNQIAHGFLEKKQEDLSLIREHLVQIENQQCSLLDLLQRFMGSSQEGMRALETRVRGLERAVNGISHELWTSSRIPATARSQGAAATACCMPPGGEFWSSRFWRRSAEDQQQADSSSAASLAAGLRRIVRRNAGLEAARRGSGALQIPVFVNPLAEIHDNSAEAPPHTLFPAGPPNDAAAHSVGS